MTRSPRLITAALVFASASAACGADSYILTDLGVLPGGGFSFGLSINASGQVTGSSDAQDQDGFGMRGFFMDRSVMIDLGLPPVFMVLSSSAPALNDAGAIVVNGNNGAQHAFLWFEGGFTDLTSLGNAIYSEGRRVNNDGHVVGSVVLDLGGGNFPHHAFFYDGIDMHDLNPNFGGTYSDATDINDAGAIVGSARFAGNSIIHGFLLKNGNVTNLGPSAGITSEAEAINSSDHIAGGAYFDGTHEHPMTWVNGQMTDLGLLPLSISGTATAINDAGVVVGQCKLAAYNQKRGFVYANGAMLSLTDLIPRGTGWTVQEANDINVAGTIVATARDPQGLKHAVVLTPVAGCDADFNGDGVVDAGDLSIVLGDWGSCPGCPSDLNGDGDVNAAEIALLLGAWGACP